MRGQKKEGFGSKIGFLRKQVLQSDFLKAIKAGEEY